MDEKKVEKDFKDHFESEIRVCSADDFLQELAKKYSEDEKKEDGTK